MFFGEVGLTGEVRGANLAVERAKEAAKLGFKKIFLPASNQRYMVEKDFKDVEFVWIREVGEIESRFGGTRNLDSGRKGKTSRTDMDV